jgi:H+-translocating NAD(P) transhydrogenase subunit alpha
MIVAVPSETSPSERRVALVPAAVPLLVKQGHTVRIQRDAGAAAGYPDARYSEKGAAIVADRAELLGAAEVVLQVRTPSANPGEGARDYDLLRSGQILIGLADPLTAGESIPALAARGITLFALELMPRITRAQDMDVLSSQASLAGYKAVVRAAEILEKVFPMMMTAAGTIRPTKVFIIGAGVAGLQAIATAKRLGAIVSAFDVRPAVKEQVQSLGARFVELPIDTATAEDQGGYAKAQSEEQLHRQQELMARVVSESDVVITTALIPGQKAPTLVTRTMVEAMPTGAVVVDLAAERGGNCELTQPGKTIRHNGVTIVGDDNLVAGVAYHASQMYANNVARFLKHLTRDGKVTMDLNDEITHQTLVTHQGEVVHPRVRQVLGLSPPEAAGPPPPATPGATPATPLKPVQPPAAE